MKRKRLILLLLLLLISILIVPRGTFAAGGCYEYLPGGSQLSWVTDSLDLGTTTQTFYINTDWWNRYGFRVATASVTFCIDSVSKATAHNVADIDSVKLDVQTVSRWSASDTLTPNPTADTDVTNTLLTVIATGAQTWGVPTAWYDLKYLMEQAYGSSGKQTTGAQLGDYWKFTVTIYTGDSGDGDHPKDEIRVKIRVKACGD